MKLSGGRVSCLFATEVWDARNEFNFFNAKKVSQNETKLDSYFLRQPLPGTMSENSGTGHFPRRINNLAADNPRKSNGCNVFAFVSLRG